MQGGVQDAAQFDRRMAAAICDDTQLVWRAVPCTGVQVRGLGFFEQEKAWCRLPQALLPGLCAQHPALGQLAWHTAGASLAFCTDSPEVWVRARLASPPYMSHMAPTAQCGFDCYARYGGGGWRLAGVSKFALDTASLCARVAQGLPEGVQVQVGLPLYVGVEALELGLVPGTRVWAPPPLAGPAAAFYGTSITQGGCASRPGMTYPAILQRQLGVPVYNMGFSGNGLGMPALAPLLCALPRLGALVVDIEPKAGPAGVLERNLPLFLDAVRAYRPGLPILVLSAPAQGQEAWDAALTARCAGWARFQQQEVERRRAGGDGAIQYVSARSLMGGLGAEATVDGVHLTDLGFYALARGLAPLVRRLLSGGE